MSDDPGTAPKMGDELGIVVKIQTPKDPVNPNMTPSVADRLSVVPVDYKKLHNKGKGKAPSDKGAKDYIDSSSSDDGLVDRKNPLGSPHSLGKMSSGKTPKATGSGMEDTDDEVVRLQNELDELTKQEEQLAKRRQADDLRRQV